MSTSSTYDSTVNSFYLAFYGRPADVVGLKFWSQQLAANDGDLGAITAAFSTSAEAQARFGGDSLAERITDIYAQLFNRTPDDAGLAYWMDAIEQGHASLADVAVSILHGAQGDDATLSAMRQQAADAFTAAVEAGGSAYSGYAAIEAARILVRAVTIDATPADIDAIVKAAVSFADTATRTPMVVEAIATGNTLLGLFDTPRGLGSPVDLAQTLADTAKAAAGDPVTLDSLLRGGGMDKVLKVMPANATLKDVVVALAEGGLPAAVEVVYPSSTSAPVMKIAFLGVQQGEGDAVVDNVTNVAQAKVEFSYSGKTLARTEHFEYSLDGETWTTAGLEVLKVGTKNVVSIAAVDLAQGSPLGVQSFGIDSHADLGTTVYLRAVGANGKAIASASQAIVYDSYAAAPAVTVDEDPVASHFGTGLHHVRDLQAVAIGAIEPGAHLEYQVNGAGSARNIEPVWTTVAPVFEEGVNIIRVRQVDAAGNASETTTLTFTLDTKAPEAPAIALQEDTGIDAHDGITSNAKVLISGLDTLPTTGWEYSTDGTTWIFGGVNDGSGTAVFDAAVLGEGGVTLQVRQIDAAGNTSTADQLQLTYDKTTPVETLDFVRIEGEPEGIATTAQTTAGITFAVHGKDDGIVEWRFKGDTAWTALAAGDYNSDGSFTLADVDLTQSDPTIEVRVIDAAGNLGAAFSQAIDGPYVKPVIQLGVGDAGLLVLSPVAGTVTVGASVAQSNDASHGAIAGTVTLGAQQQLMQGTVAVTPQGGAPITSGSPDVFGLGTNGADAMSGRYLWGFDGADELTGTADADYLNGGAGADIIHAGSGRDTIVGGSGADEIDLGKDGMPDTLVYSAGDTMDTVFANGGSAAAMDRITGAEQGDVFQLGNIFIQTPTVGDTFLTSADAGHVAVVRGTLASGAFTAGTTGTSYVLQWSDGSHVNSVILADYGNRAPTLDINAALGTVTLGAPAPLGSALASLGFDLLGAASKVTFSADGAQITGLHNAATFAIKDYGTGAALPTAIDYTAAPGFGVDGNVMTLSQSLHAGLYQMSWQDDTFSTDTGYLKAGSLYFAGGSDGLFHFEGIKMYGSVFTTRSGGGFGSDENNGYVFAATNDLNKPSVDGGGGHDVYAKAIRTMTIEINDFMQESDSDLAINFDTGVDKVRFQNQPALRLDHDFDGQIRWATQPGQDGRVVLGSADEGAKATIGGDIHIGGSDTSSIVTELNKVFDVSHVAQGSPVLFLVDDGGIGNGAALFYFENKNGDGHIDADEVISLLMFADGVPQTTDIVLVGTASG